MIGGCHSDREITFKSFQTRYIISLMQDYFKLKGLVIFNMWQ